MAIDPREEPDHSEKSSSSGWLDSLAQRSAGLPGKETKVSKPEPGNDKALWRMAGLGVQFAVTVAIFAILGREADKRLGWTPWGVVSFTVLAVVGNLYLLIKESMRDGDPKSESRKKKL